MSLICAALAGLSVMLARVVLQQWLELARLRGQLEALGVVEPDDRVPVERAPFTVGASSAAAQPGPGAGTGPVELSQPEAPARTSRTDRDHGDELEAALAIEAIDAERLVQAYALGVADEQAWLRWYTVLALHARMLQPGEALLDMLRPGDGSYPIDGSAPTLEQATALSSGILAFYRLERGKAERAASAAPGVIEDPAARMMEEARRMQEQAEADLLAACPPIVVGSPSVSSASSGVGPSPTPAPTPPPHPITVTMPARGAVDEAIVMWSEDVDRARRSHGAGGGMLSPARSLGRRSPPGYDSAFVSALHRAIAQDAVTSEGGGMRLRRSAPPNRATPPVYSPGTIDAPSYFELYGDASRADG